MVLWGIGIPAMEILVYGLVWAALTGKFKYCEYRVSFSVFCFCLRDSGEGNLWSYVMCY